MMSFALPDYANPTTEIAVDNLTGLGNMFALLQALKCGLQKASASPGTLCSFVLLDIDNLSEINAIVGVEAADYMIKTVASTMYRTVQEMNRAGWSGKLYRFANDEFALVVLHSDCEELQRVVRKLQNSVNSLQWERYPRAMTISASMACYPACARSLGDVLAYTHLFMSKGKGQGAGGTACPGSPEYQDEDQLSVDLHNNATSLVEALTLKVLETASLLSETQQLAHTDPTTGLPNSRAVRKTLEMLIHQSAESSTPLGAMFIDGDRLKEYNQLFGYDAGNQMIKWLGEKLRSMAYQNCFVGRWLSGDEFVVICPGVDASTTMERAERLRRAVERDSGELLLPITISIGMVAYPQHGSSVDELVAAMEAANMQAKITGRNQVVRFENTVLRVPRAGE